MRLSVWKTATLFLFTLSMALILTLSDTLVLQVPAASAHTTKAVQQTSSASVVSPTDVKNCGIVTCSYYFSRAHTNWIAAHGAYAAIAAGLIPAFLAKIIGAVIGLVTAKAVEARSKHQCLRVRYGLVVGLYSDGSKYCHNT
jgi:energy-converting hydrogenase Eha subunit A